MKKAASETRWVRRAQQLVKRWGADCSSCPFAVNGQAARPVLGQFPKDGAPAGVVVGESPGEEEELQGIPFAGQTGRVFDEALHKAGIQRSKLAIVNAIACRAPRNRTEGALSQAARCCAPVLKAQLERASGSQKLPMLATGKWAATAVMGTEKGVMNTRGFIREDTPVPGGTADLIVTWHPTYAAFRNPYEWGAFTIDLDRFARLMRGEIKLHTEVIIQKPRVWHLKKLYEWALRTGSPLSMDIESKPATSEEPWTAKDPTRAHLDLIGFGNTQVGLSIKWKKASVAMKRLVKRVLEDPRVQKELQNGDWFDIRVMRRYGVETRNVFDTRDARRALSSTSPLSLSHMVSIYVDSHPWKEKGDSEEKGALWQKPEYNAYDCVRTSQVGAGIRAEPEWNTPRVQALYEQHRHLARIYAQMHQHGVFVDKERRDWLAWASLQEYGEHEAKLKALVNMDGFECNPNHMRALIFQKHACGKYAHLARFNLPDPLNPAMYVDEKEMDAISVDEDSLTYLLIDPDVPQELKTIIEAYWEAQSVWKQRSTFVVSEKVSRAIGPDNRLRAGWNSCGTDTGRPSCSEPNLLNIIMLMRWMYTAPPGWVMVGADWSQIELRVRAIVMGDRQLAKDLVAGDVYSENAKAWWGLPADMDVKKLKPAARQSSKIIHLASQYAAGTNTVFRQGLKQDRNLKYEVVKGLHDGFKRTYSDTARFWEEELKRVCETGYSETRIMGRRRHYPREPPITETANYPIQGTAGDIANIVTIELDERLQREVPSAQLVIQQYDAFYAYARERDALKVKSIIEEAMTRDFVIEGKTYNFPAKAKIGHSWDELG